MIPNPDARTYRDLIDVLVYKLGAATDERNQSQVRSAIRNAYLILANKRNWSFLWKMGRIEFQLPQSTGTVQYTQANQQVVLTGATWPGWVNAYSRIRIGIVNSQVSQVLNSTTLLLDPVLNFGQDISAGTAYTIYKNLFPLPGDFKAMGHPRGEASFWSSSYISPEDWMTMERAYGGTTTGGVPVAWTIFGDTNTPNGMMIGVWPWPSIQATYDFMYQASARNLQLTGLTTACQGGTVAGTSGTNTLTGTSTNWSSAMAGAVLRIGSTTVVPTGIEGLDPYLEQHLIASVQSATGLTLADNLTGTYSGNKYIISDPMNLHESMYPALLRRAELELADLKDRGKYSEQESRWRRAYFEAGEADTRMLSPQFAKASVLPTRPAIRYMPYTIPSS